MRFQSLTAFAKVLFINIKILLQMEELKIIEEKLNKFETLFINQKTVLNLEEVAAYTGLSKSCLYKKTSTGGIPCYKPNGKHIYFNKNEIDKWLLSNRKATSEEIETAATNYCLTNKRGGGK